MDLGKKLVLKYGLLTKCFLRKFETRFSIQVEFWKINRVIGYITE